MINAPARLFVRSVALVVTLSTEICLAFWLHARGHDWLSGWVSYAAAGVGWRVLWPACREIVRDVRDLIHQLTAPPTRPT